MTSNDITDACGELRRQAQSLIQAAQELLAAAAKLDPCNAENTPLRVATDFSVLPGRSAELRAEALYMGRRIRDKMFPQGLFGEPAWDILLDLYLAQANDKPLGVTAVCLGSQVPATTALRYIALLEDAGLVMREPDSADNRRILVQLTVAGTQSMESFFEFTDVRLLPRKRASEPLANLRAANAAH
ncbi:MarR family transcriptional regulator [Novosphingobium tardum]|uniref:MarR family transcriptional regulator n=1 Tax=Novosphingobium tardum TaxID=1538021 RepID=A0ABV8RUW6_9SPHN